MIEIKGKYNEAKIFTDVVASPSASSGWPMKKASVISAKRPWTPLRKSFWIRTIPGTTVPWSGFKEMEEEYHGTDHFTPYSGTAVR